MHIRILPSGQSLPVSVRPWLCMFWKFVSLLASAKEMIHKASGFWRSPFGRGNSKLRVRSDTVKGGGFYPLILCLFFPSRSHPFHVLCSPSYIMKKVFHWDWSNIANIAWAMFSFVSPALLGLLLYLGGMFLDPVVEWSKASIGGRKARNGWRLHRMGTSAFPGALLCVDLFASCGQRWCA